MRLLVVTNDYPPRPGGIQQYLGSLVAAYPHQVRVLAPRDPDADPHAVGVARGPHRFMWPTPRVARWVEREARAFDPDAVLFGAPYPLPWLGPWLRNRIGRPYAVLGHGAEITVPAAIPGLRQFFARYWKAADVLVANAGFAAGKLEAVTGRPVTVIGAGVDVEAFTPAPAPPRNDPPVVGCVSRFVPRKGQHRLLEAAAEVRRRGRDLEVLLVGSGRREAPLRRLAERLGVPTRFEVGVPWAALPDAYRAMDVFCAPVRSRWGGLEAEGLGLVFLEAAACGLPVVAGDSGGAPETVDPGRTGFVAHSVGDVVEALELLLGDLARARHMGAAGRERVVAEFTWSRTADRLLEALGAVARS